MKIPQPDKQIFQKYRIRLAYLFGSRAKGLSADTSDFDVAVLFKGKNSGLSPRQEITFLSLELDQFFPAKLDIVSLNDAPLLLKYEAVANGKILYCEKESERINFEVSVIKEYIDEQPIRRLYNQALHKRILQAM